MPSACPSRSRVQEIASSSIWNVFNSTIVILYSLALKLWTRHVRELTKWF
jgi:hypothetical protein